MSLVEKSLVFTGLFSYPRVVHPVFIVEANRPIRKTLRSVKEDGVNWDTTENLNIEGDNLEALKLLQESCLGKVKMIYIEIEIANWIQGIAA